MRTSMIDVRVVESNRIWARYQGVIDKHIAVSSAACLHMPQRVLDAVLAHELAHHQLWHVELKLGGWAASVAFCLFGPWTLWVPFFLFMCLSSLLIENEADQRAAHSGFDMRFALEWMLEYKLSWWQRRQLRLRLRMLK